MPEKLLPSPISNHYAGPPLAKWAFAILTIITIGRSLVHMLAADGGTQSIASIPINTYSSAAADTLVTMFALWGLSQLIIGVIYALVLWRYQSLIPLMYAFFTFEYFMRLIIPSFKPGIETISRAPGEVGTIIFVPLGLLLLFLSLRSRRGQPST